MGIRSFGIILVATSALSITVASAQVEWVAPNVSSGAWTEDATPTYSNFALKTPWQNPLGDWRDADGVPQGSKAWAKTDLVDDNKPNAISFDVTAMLRAGKSADFMIRRNGGTDAGFRSSEAAEVDQRPVLIVDGVTYPITEDTYLTNSTSQPLGNALEIRTKGNLLLRAARAPAPVSSAILTLYSTGSEFGNQALELFEANPRKVSLSGPDIPIVALDQTYQISAKQLYEKLQKDTKTRATLNADDSYTGSMTWPGQLTVSDAIIRLPDNIRSDFVCETTIIRLEKGWRASAGKLPGLTNTGQTSPGTTVVGGVTYADAGWGGRGANGLRWSARTGFHGYMPTNPTSEKRNGHPTYIYALDTPSVFGWNVEGNESIEVGRWVAKESCVNLNDVGQANGWHAIWVDGVPSVFVAGLKWRNVDDTESLINEYWGDIYCGGTSCNNGTFSASIKAVYISKEGRADPVAIANIIADLNRLSSSALEETPSSKATLSIAVKGAGRVTSTPENVSCGSDCRYANDGTGEMSLEARPGVRSAFDHWSGECGGSGVCRVPVGKDASVVANFKHVERLGLVMATQHQLGSSSFRIQNTDEVPGHVKITLAHGQTGRELATWQSPDILPMTAIEVPIAHIERLIQTASPTTSVYTAIVEPEMSGFFQHVVLERVSGTQVNLSLCEGSTFAASHVIPFVRSSLVTNAETSAIVATNPGTVAAPVKIEIYEGLFGQRLGEYVSPIIPAGGQLQITAAELEAAARIVPGPAHYTIVAGADFPGFLQHLSTSRRSGAVADMTAMCTFDGGEEGLADDGTLETGPLYALSEDGSQSFLRIHNTTTAPTRPVILLRDSTTGVQVAKWSSPKIPANGSYQVPVSTLESAMATKTKKNRVYTASVQLDEGQSLQNVFYSPTERKLSNRSACQHLGTSTNHHLINVHTGSLNTTYPNSVFVINTSQGELAAKLNVFDSVTGTKLGTYVTPAIPVQAQLEVSTLEIETSLNIPSSVDRAYLLITAEEPFTGMLQSMVVDSSSGGLSNLTLACAR